MFSPWTPGRCASDGGRSWPWCQQGYGQGSGSLWVSLTRSRTLDQRSKATSVDSGCYPRAERAMMNFQYHWQVKSLCPYWETDPSCHLERAPEYSGGQRVADPTIHCKCCICSLCHLKQGQKTESLITRVSAANATRAWGPQNLLDLHRTDLYRY